MWGRPNIALKSLRSPTPEYEAKKGDICNWPDQAEGADAKIVEERDHSDHLD